MRRMILVALLAAGALLVAACGDDDGDDPEAPDRGTADEAVAMVERAIEAYDEDGGAVFDRITAPSTEFVDRDLYVFVLDGEGTTVAHGANADNVGLPVDELVDEDGNAFGRAFLENATAEGAWVDYSYIDPISGELAAKSAWVVLHDGYVFGTGIYKPE